MMIKISFIRAICLTNDEYSEWALRETVYTKDLAKKFFGVKSSFYVDMVLNEAYLRREDYAQSSALINEVI